MSAPIVERLRNNAPAVTRPSIAEIMDEAADTITDLLAVLVSLERWFDTDDDILAAMDADTLADHKRQHSKISAAIAKAKGGAA